MPGELGPRRALQLLPQLCLLRLPVPFSRFCCAVGPPGLIEGDPRDTLHAGRAGLLLCGENFCLVRATSGRRRRGREGPELVQHCWCPHEAAICSPCRASWPLLPPSVEERERRGEYRLPASSTTNHRIHTLPCSRPTSKFQNFFYDFQWPVYQIWRTVIVN